MIFCLFKFLRFLGLRMSKRLSFYGLVALASVCIFFLAFNQRYSSYLEHRLQPMISVSTKFGGGDCSKLSHAKHALSEDGKSLTFAPKKKKPLFSLYPSLLNDSNAKRRTRDRHRDLSFSLFLSLFASTSLPLFPRIVSAVYRLRNVVGETTSGRLVTTKRF